MSYVNKISVNQSLYDIKDSNFNIEQIIQIQKDIDIINTKLEELENKGVDLSDYYNKTEINNQIQEAIMKVVRVKGILLSIDNLPISNNEIGDMYIIVENEDNNSEYVWTGDNWEYIGQKYKIDLSNYYTKSEIDDIVTNITEGDGNLADGDTLNITCG